MTSIRTKDNRLKKKIFLQFLFFTGLLLFISCKKEASQQGTDVNNKPPVANAGANQAITTDSVLLDGSASSDPDGTIAEWYWIKISGPAIIISTANGAKPVVKNLIQGVHLFELTVKDNGGLSAKDTVQIDVNIPNRPPVAKAGADQTITLPVNTFFLNGSGSTDPDNNITNYFWTKISGPASFSLANANGVQTQVANLSTGIYQFELKVTDAGSLFNRDTMQVTVQPEPSCFVGTRPQFSAQLIPVGTLGKPRRYMAVASAGNKIVFAGGLESSGPLGVAESAFVDIYDLSTQAWSSTFLSKARHGISVVTNGNKIFFAGGEDFISNYFGDYFSNVDIYDVLTNTWTVTALSEPKTEVAATAVANKVMFAGGYKITGDDFPNNIVTTVDIYDLSSNSWSIKQLSEARGEISAVTAGNEIYFAGGIAFPGVPSGKIDIYNNASNTWSVSALNFITFPYTGQLVNDKIYWAGSGCNIEVRNINTGAGTSASLSKPGASFSVLKDGKMVFLRTASAQFDIYDIATDIWSIGILPQPIPTGASIIAVNNKIYVAGGVPVNSSTVSSVVYRLDF